jgi:NADPH:quinone reductase-like Zn-dependent oxidoreductase
MNAAVVTDFKTPPRYTTFADPVAGEGEKLVHVAAAGLHPIVKALANGSHYGSTGELPFVPGVDGVGRLKDGSRVFFGNSRAPFGTFAEQALAADWMLVPLPDGLDDATAAGIANPGMSSWVALMRGKFVAGESVLILGATGVAGQLAVQIAKRRGAKRVIAAGRNPAALEKLMKLGADYVISLDQNSDSVTADFKDEFDQFMPNIVLDYLWGGPAESVLKAVTWGRRMSGTSRVRFVQIGNSAGPNISLPAATLRSSGLELLGSGFGSASLEQIRDAVAEFFVLAVKEPFNFKVKTAPLSNVEALWNVREEEGTRLVFQP